MFNQDFVSLTTYKKFNCIQNIPNFDVLFSKEGLILMDLLVNFW